MDITGEITVRHRGYTMEFTKGSGKWYGKIKGIDDLVTASAAKFFDMEREAKLAIDDYIETCAELGTKPNKPRR